MTTELLTIGDFARASGLTPKALRLYDDLGLLRPAEVDPSSGYRRYAPEQLGQARLVATLRLVGMPLARSRRSSTRLPRWRRGWSRPTGSRWSTTHPAVATSSPSSSNSWRARNHP